MSEQKIINVHIGQIHIAKKNELLKAILGSCVGIGLIWREKKICGLAHCLLPELNTASFDISGRYVTQALPSLLALMKIRASDIPQIEAVLAGGANMTGSRFEDPQKLIGTCNSQTALRILKERGIKIIHQDFGGTQGRQIIINSENFLYEVKKFPRNAITSGDL